jgi:hypothetical protein
MLHIVTVLAILFAKNTLYKCVVIFKGVIMSVNFGYGGMNMMGGMGMMNGVQNSQGTGNVFREMKEKYGCDHCYQYGPVPYNYPMHVNPLPQNVTDPSLLRRIFRRFFGG